MLPQQVFQLDYQDYSELVSNHINKILTYETEHKLKFDMILAKSRSGLFASSIISNLLNLSLGLIEISKDNDNVTIEQIFFPTSTKNKIKNNEKLSILFVDSTCQTGKTLNQVKKFMSKEYPNINLITYCTLINNQSDYLPEISGLVVDSYIQPPWEWLSFTPQSHLERLETGFLKTAESSFCIGLCSENCKEELFDIVNKKYDNIWFMTFPIYEDKIATVSGISTTKMPSSITFEQAKTTYKHVIKEKADFIKLNGLTHFIEKDLMQALLLSSEVPVAHVIFYDGKEFYKIYNKSVDKNFLFK